MKNQRKKPKECEKSNIWHDGSIIKKRKKLAEKMGVTDKGVSKGERDLSYPDIGSLPLLAEILGVSLDELM